MTRLIAALLAMTALVVTGCTSVVDGKAIAGDVGRRSESGVYLTGDGYGVILGTSQDGAAELYIEPQCPHCGDFIADYGPAILDEIEAGRLAMTFRPVTFLDGGDNDYSARASNAMFLVAEEEDATPELVMDFIMALYENMLSSSTVMSDDDIAQTADDVGASADTVNRVAAAEPALDTVDMADANLGHMDDIGASGTPTVYDLIAETDVDINDPDWIATVTGR